MAQSPIQFTAKLTKAFVDAKKIQREVDSSKRKSIVKSLAWIRRTWRSTLKRRKSTSPAGSPPHIHKAGLGLKTIFFYYDSAEGAGGVGPVKLEGFGADDNALPLPGLLEGGGMAKLPSGRRVNLSARPSGAPVLQKGIRTGEIVDPFAGMVN